MNSTQPIVSEKADIEMRQVSRFKGRKPVFETLQAGRGLAAISVVIYHLNVAIFGVPNIFPRRFWAGFSFGHAGVEYFFVVSGFIIAYLHWDDIGASRRFLPFLQKRFSRIYPPYWAVLIIVLPIHFANPRFIPDGSILYSLLSDLTLAPTRHRPDLVVAWTLKHEILFYIVFAVMVLNRRVGITISLAAITGSLCYIMISTSSTEAESSVRSLLFSPMHLLFLYGAAIVLVIRKCRIPHPALLGAGGLALFLGTGIYECYLNSSSYPNIRSQLYGVGSAIGVAGFVELERQGRVLIPRALRLLGDASYSIYLIHFPLLSSLSRVIVRMHYDTLPASLIFLGLAMIAIASGIGFHLAVEKPLLRRFSYLPMFRNSNQPPRP